MYNDIPIFTLDIKKVWNSLGALDDVLESLIFPEDWPGDRSYHSICILVLVTMCHKAEAN